MTTFSIGLVLGLLAVIVGLLLRRPRYDRYVTKIDPSMACLPVAASFTLGELVTIVNLLADLEHELSLPFGRFHNYDTPLRRDRRKRLVEKISEKIDNAVILFELNRQQEEREEDDDE